MAETFESSNGDYHNLPGVSNSRLSDYITGGPELYHGRYIAQPALYPREEPTPAMQFGTNVHAVVEAGSIGAVFTVIPPDALNDQGHRKGPAWKQFAEEHKGKVLVKYEDIAVYSRILENVKANEKAAAILYGQGGHNELNLRWNDQETGLLCRCRFDRIVPDRFICDIKTTRSIDPRQFSSTVYSYGYHRQAAMYAAGWAEYTEQELPFIFIAIQNEPPYAVACYTLDQPFFDKGWLEVQTNLRKLKEHYDSGVWTRPAEVLEIAAPGYARYSEQWETEQV